jgi:filamentous hemagglutinin family protein
MRWSFLLHHGVPPRCFFLKILIVSSLLLVLQCLSPKSQAQTPPITSSGLNTQISGPIPVEGRTQFNITGGTRPAGGANLFHSFGDFGVPTNNIANFLNETALPTSNILGRVTGGNLSSIYGTIQTEGFGSANLFLMNPAGFLFGPGAQVNIGGMAHFTTADYLKLADGNLFKAMPDPAADLLLSAAPVAAFGFLGSNPGAITVQGSQLSVAEGTGLSFVGGNITIESGVPAGGTAQPAQLLAPKGKIQLASAASPGEFDAITLQSLPNLDAASFTSFGSVSLAPDSTINVSVSGANTVSIRGGQFVLWVNDAVLSTADSAASAESIALGRDSSIITSSSGTDAGADIQLAVDNITLDGALIKSSTTGDGAGGSITLTTQSTRLTNGAQVVSSSEAAGSGGAIALSATDTVTLSGYDAEDTLSGITTPFLFNPNTGEPLVASSIITTSAGTGNGGHVTVTGPAVTVETGATVATIASGDGRGGNLTINGENITVANGALMLSSAGQDFTTFEVLGSGAGGDITITGSSSILISGNNLDLFALSTVLAQSASTGSGGNIVVSAPVVSLDNGASVASLASGDGPGGNISISANSQLSLTGFSEDFGIGSSITSLTGTSATGGSISISDGSVTVQELGTISTLTSVAGPAGNIILDVENVNLASGGTIISSSSGEGSTGAIAITAGDTVSISGQFEDGTPSSVENAQQGAGNNGGIAIRASEFLLDEGANIQTASDGPVGGGIGVSADSAILVSGSSSISLRLGANTAGAGIVLAAPSLTIDNATITTRTISTFDAGPISLTGELLRISGGSQIRTDTAQPTASGEGGPIVLSASDSIVISDGSRIEASSISGSTGSAGHITATAVNLMSISGLGSGLFSTTEASGNGGPLTIQANQVRIIDGAVISANSTGTGAAGSVTIEGTLSPAQSVLIDGAGSGIFTNTQSTGAGGNISVNANSVTMNNGSSVSASSSGLGATGNIQINAGNLFAMTNKSSVTTEANQASGGTIKITTTPSGTVQLINSTISASAHDGTGGGGSVDIDPLYVILLDSSHILANAVEGPGGNITINISNGGLFLPDATSTVSASSQFGVNGTVTIQSPNAPASGKIQPLGKTPLLPTSLLNQRCASLAGGEFSSFTVAGRDSLPTEPSSWLTSPLALATLSAGTGIAERGEGLEGMTLGASIVSETELLSLRQIAPAGFLTQAFALDWSAGCTS